MSREGNDVGEIEDIVADLQQGMIRYAIADIGGFLGVAEQTILLPWNRITLDAENRAFNMDVDEDTLQNAPAFDRSQFDLNNLGPDWDANNADFWEQYP